MNQILYSDQQLAVALAVSRATIWRMVKRGDLPAPIRLGKAARWRRDEVQVAIDRLTSAQREGEA